MDPGSKRHSGTKPERANQGPERKGSVQRARQLLEAGEHPKVLTPEAKKDFLEAPSTSSKASHMTQWPLPDNSTQPGAFLDPQGSHISRGPPPPRPPRPDAPSPSVYSERSAPGTAPSPLHFKQPYQSFSQPFPRRSSAQSPAGESSSLASQRSAASFTPGISVINEDRRSAVSDTASAPSISNFPLSTPYNGTKTASLAPPQPPPLSRSTQHHSNRESFVSPIPEESGSSEDLEGSYASSTAVPSLGSGPCKSKILGTYLDADSEDSEEAQDFPEGENGEGLVRQASLGKRSKPSLRVIRKPNPDFSQNQASASEGTVERGFPGTAVSGSQNDGLRVPSPKASFSSLSDRSYEFDLEKGAFVLDIGQSHPTPQQAQDDTGNRASTSADLPRAAPTMSDIRPGARRPPRLDMNAVRDAEARGSLTSMSDLIKRATKLATNLDHGRTASRNDVLNDAGGSRLPPWENRHSGSIQDALASFPPPPRQGERSSWPVFFRRSTFHNIERVTSQDPSEEKQPNKPRRCCGMPLWLFITICVAVLIIITLAVLLPVFLVAVPQQKSNNQSTCEETTPCKNGGVSVSSGPICSCVCVNGYSGSQCTIPQDGSCTTAAIDGGSSSKTITMGSDLPQLFEDARETFNIPLDQTTIMALFSKSNVSCTTQNELVSFRDITSKKSRRSLPVVKQEDGLLSTLEPTQTLAARDSVATENGIIFDDSSPSQTSSTTVTPTTPSEPTSSSEEISTSTPTRTGTVTAAGSSPTSTATSTTAPTPIPHKALSFSRAAILYILEMTGEFNATTQSQQNIQCYLTSTYSNSGAGSYDVDLSRAGVRASFALDFDQYTITMGNGASVGG